MSFFYQKKFILYALLVLNVFACANKQHIDYSEIRKAADRATEQMEQNIDHPTDIKTEFRQNRKGKTVIMSDQDMPGHVTDISGSNVREEDGWIVVVAECPAVNISRQEAMRRALNEARNNAIEYVVGIQVSSSEFLSQSTNQLASFVSYINISSYGKIIEEQDPKWEEIEIGKNKQGLTLWKYRVILKCKVQKEEENPDPGFVLKLRANKMKYKTGDEIQFSVTSSRECYLTVFNFYESDDKVFIIFPNDFDNNNKLIANEPRIIPASASGISFEALLPEGQNESQELILAVATKEPVDFSMGLKKISAFSFISTPVAAITEINRRLVTIPLNERAQISDVLLIER